MEPIQVLGTTLILVTVLCVFLIVKYFKIKSLNNLLIEKNSKLQTKVSGFKNYIPGRKGLLYNFGLEQSSTKTSFNVTSMKTMRGF